MGELFAFLGLKRWKRAPIAPPIAVAPERWEDGFCRSMHRAQADDDFMFLICDLDRTVQLHARIADIQACVTEKPCDFMSPSVCRERGAIRDQSMAWIADDALDSTWNDWIERSSHFAALVGEFHERIHKLKMLYRT